ncbi:FeoA family protein [Pseudanabaena sp. PCC 6802]|uniref:FeoA family protein n=1 Tax=Pseudanabaena sp. PCC 6802 TaxID=118173 RepID=UPI00034D7D91|nr:FeoA family protein [Pseudanabaena sp. PCC 6802]
MFAKAFTVSGSSLQLLHPGEEGIVNKVRSNDDRVVQKLEAMGIAPGTSITLEKRYPAFTVKAGQKSLVLEEQLARAIYVRVFDSHPISPS